MFNHLGIGAYLCLFSLVASLFLVAAAAGAGCAATDRLRRVMQLATLIIAIETRNDDYEQTANDDDDDNDDWG